jgi:hypothetical protein
VLGRPFALPSATDRTPAKSSRGRVPQTLLGHFGDRCDCKPGSQGCCWRCFYIGLQARRMIKEHRRSRWSAPPKKLLRGCRKHLLQLRCGRFGLCTVDNGTHGSRSGFRQLAECGIRQCQCPLNFAGSAPCHQAARPFTFTLILGIGRLRRCADSVDVDWPGRCSLFHETFHEAFRGAGLPAVATSRLRLGHFLMDILIRTSVSNSLGVLYLVCFPACFAQGLRKSLRNQELTLPRPHQS